MITKPSWDCVRPCTGYAAPYQAVPDCGRFAAVGGLRQGLGKVVDCERPPGLFAENARLAEWLAEEVGIPREKIHVIPAAVAERQGPLVVRPPHVREAPHFKLLLCIGDGPDFALFFAAEQDESHGSPWRVP